MSVPSRNVLVVFNKNFYTSLNDLERWNVGEKVVPYHETQEDEIIDREFPIKFVRTFPPQHLYQIPPRSSNVDEEEVIVFIVYIIPKNIKIRELSPKSEHYKICVHPIDTKRVF